MFFSLAMLAGLATAAVTPLTPATAKVGDALQIQWDADTTGTWQNVSIDFMSGDNWNMVLMENVANGIDGTTQTSYSWTVPDVSIYSKVYFFQFTNNGADPTWCTRFTIESAAGATVAPPQSIQPDGQTIGWGSASLIGGATTPSSAPISQSSSSGSASAAGSSNQSASSSSSNALPSPTSSSNAQPSINQQNDESSGAGKVAAGVGFMVALTLGLIMA